MRWSVVALSTELNLDWMTPSEILAEVLQPSLEVAGISACGGLGTSRVHNVWYVRPMSDVHNTRAEKPDSKLRRYVAPALLAVGMIVVAASWALGVIGWWLADVTLLILLTLFISVIQRNRNSRK